MAKVPAPSWQQPSMSSRDPLNAWDRTVEQQGGLCADCGDTLEGIVEIDHRTPLCFRGSHKAENLAALCRACHKQKSSMEQLGNVEDHNPLVSHFNRETHAMFAMSRKPPQLVANVHLPASYTHLRAHATVRNLVCRLLLVNNNLLYIQKLKSS